MYKKIIFIICVLLIFLGHSYALENVYQKPEIISREEWWADELYTDVNSSYWRSIIENRKNRVDTRTEEQKQKSKENYERSIQYINENFLKENTRVEIKTHDENTWLKYAWPLGYTQEINAIVIHHTHDEYEDSYTWIKQIYKYHAINREWWDIWYNYIIWYDGEIFEGREGGDFVSWAHTKWNNYSTVWIALMWDYEEKGLNEAQYKSLEELVKYLSWRYGIDLSKKHYYHRECRWDSCDVFPIETRLDSVLVWHRDTWHTNCPWEVLYSQIQKIRTDNLDFSQWFTPRKYTLTQNKAKVQVSYTTSQISKYSKILHWYSNEERKIILKKVEQLLLQDDIEHERRKKLQVFRLAIVLSVKN